MFHTDVEIYLCDEKNPNNHSIRHIVGVTTPCPLDIYVFFTMNTVRNR